MKGDISTKRTVWSLGILFGVMHLLWVLSVAIFGKDVDVVAKIHFIDPFSTLPFSVGTAILGVILAFVSGMITGWFFAWVYNKIKA